MDSINQALELIDKELSLIVSADPPSIEDALFEAFHTLEELRDILRGVVSDG